MSQRIIICPVISKNIATQETIINEAIQNPRIKRVDQIIILPTHDGILVYILFEVA